MHSGDPARDLAEWLRLCHTAAELQTPARLAPAARGTRPPNQAPENPLHRAALAWAAGLPDRRATPGPPPPPAGPLLPPAARSPGTARTDTRAAIAQRLRRPISPDAEGPRRADRDGPSRRCAAAPRPVRRGPRRSSRQQLFDSGDGWPFESKFPQLGEIVQ